MEGNCNLGILKRFSQQFRKPQGFLGTIAGKLMATTGSKKNEWTVSLLSIQKGDRVLEIGFGPGVAIELVSKVITEGHIVGLDYSDVMLKQAQKRNRKAIQEGRVELILGDVNKIPSFGQGLTKYFPPIPLFSGRNQLKH